MAAEDPYLHYIFPSHFVSDGTVNRKLLLKDGLHLNFRGQACVMSCIRDIVATIKLIQCAPYDGGIGIQVNEHSWPSLSDAALPSHSTVEGHQTAEHSYEPSSSTKPKKEAHTARPTTPSDSKPVWRNQSSGKSSSTTTKRKAHTSKPTVVLQPSDSKRIHHNQSPSEESIKPSCTTTTERKAHTSKPTVVSMTEKQSQNGNFTNDNLSFSVSQPVLQPADSKPLLCCNQSSGKTSKPSCTTTSKRKAHTSKTTVPVLHSAYSKPLLCCNQSSGKTSKPSCTTTTKRKAHTSKTTVVPCRKQVGGAGPTEVTPPEPILQISEKLSWQDAVEILNSADEFQASTTPPVLPDSGHIYLYSSVGRPDCIDDWKCDQFQILFTGSLHWIAVVKEKNEIHFLDSAATGELTKS